MKKLKDVLKWSGDVALLLIAFAGTLLNDINKDYIAFFWSVLSIIAVCLAIRRGILYDGIKKEMSELQQQPLDDKEEVGVHEQQMQRVFD